MIPGARSMVRPGTSQKICIGTCIGTCMDTYTYREKTPAGESARIRPPAGESARIKIFRGRSREKHFCQDLKLREAFLHGLEIARSKIFAAAPSVLACESPCEFWA